MGLDQFEIEYQKQIRIISKEEKFLKHFIRILQTSDHYKYTDSEDYVVEFCLGRHIKSANKGLEQPYNHLELTEIRISLTKLVNDMFKTDGVTSHCHKLLELLIALPWMNDILTYKRNQRLTYITVDLNN